MACRSLRSPMTRKPSWVTKWIFVCFFLSFFPCHLAQHSSISRLWLSEIQWDFSEVTLSSWLFLLFPIGQCSQLLSLADVKVIPYYFILYFFKNWLLHYIVFLVLTKPWFLFWQLLAFYHALCSAILVNTHLTRPSKFYFYLQTILQILLHYIDNKIISTELWATENHLPVLQNWWYYGVFCDHSSSMDLNPTHRS